MKTSASSAAMLAFCAVLVPMGAQAQIPGTECNLVLNMKESISDPGLILKNEYGVPVRPVQLTYENEWYRRDAYGNISLENYEFGSKANAYRLSNRELLEILVDEGVITEIAGWSLKAVFRAFPADQDGSKPYLFIVKKPKNGPQQTIYIGSYFDFDGHATAKTQKYATTTFYSYDSQGNLIGSNHNEAGLIFSKRAVDVEFDSSGDSEDPEAIHLDISGTWNTSAQLRKLLLGNLNEPTFLFVPGNGSFTGISGNLHVGPDDDGSVIEGDWSFNGAKILPSISILYPEATID